MVTNNENLTALRQKRTQANSFFKYCGYQFRVKVLDNSAFIFLNERQQAHIGDNPTEIMPKVQAFLKERI